MTASWIAKGRVPSLDGLRGVSIVLVTVCHLPSIHGLPIHNSVAGILKRGNLGVDVFFVLSGFLITHLMLKESSERGRVSLKAFYARRALRIFPAYYLFLCVIAVLCIAGVYHMTPQIWVRALTYTENLAVLGDSHATGHLWSLAVEEQFYLLWPLAMVVCGARRAVYAALSAVLIAPIVRFGCWEWGQGFVNIDTFILARMDTLAVGCLLAFAVRTDLAQRYARLCEPYASTLVALCAVGVFLSAHVLGESGKYTLGPKRIVEAMLIAQIVFLSVMHPHSLVGRVLNLRFLVFLGAISYSLYLAQALLTFEREAPIWVNIAGTIVLTLVSYVLVERPFLRIKERIFAPRAEVCRAETIAA